VSIDIHQYLDFRRFLEDWFRAKKAGNPRFSHRMFARMAGQKSPSLLLQVMRSERNLTPQTTEAFIRAMGLNLDEAAFFTDLVQLGQARTGEEQNRAWARISASRRFGEARKLEGQGVELLSHWYHSAVRELAQRPDFDRDPAWIARTMRPKITPAQATQAVELLLSLGLLDEDEFGRLVTAEASVATPHEVAGMAARNYHRAMLEQAVDSIDSAHREERHLGAMTVCIPASLVPKLKREIASFEERLMDLCDSAEDPAEQVYHVEIAMFPMSAPPETP